MTYDQTIALIEACNCGFTIAPLSLSEGGAL